MRFNLLAFLELFVVLGFALGWGVLELVCLRMDRRRREEEDRGASRNHDEVSAVEHQDPAHPSVERGQETPWTRVR